jgi:hypothetical protein
MLPSDNLVTLRQRIADLELRVTQLDARLTKAEAGVVTKRTKGTKSEDKPSGTKGGRPASLSPSAAALKKRRQRAKLAKEGG